MNKIEIVDFNKDYIENILDIEKTSVFSNWSKQMFLDTCLNKNNYFKVMIDENKIVGYIIYSVILDEAEILNIVVDVNYRGRSLGKTLLEYCVNDIKNKNCSTVFLEVASKNSIAINLYKKFNFIKYNIRKKYYKNDDAVLLKKVLDK